ncbi:MAG: hypothetical protein ACKPEA_11620 [Planctomycetota bacterium]
MTKTTREVREGEESVAGYGRLSGSICAPRSQHTVSDKRQAVIAAGSDLPCATDAARHPGDQSRGIDSPTKQTRLTRRCFGKRAACHRTQNCQQHGLAQADATTIDFGVRARTLFGSFARHGLSP